MSNRAEELLTPEEVRGIFRVSRQTLWRWAKEGRLHPVRIGRTLRYRRAEIDAIFDQDARA